MSVRHGDQRQALSISWQHRTANDRIVLTTVLGQVVAELVRDRVGAVLTLADGRRYEGADWEGLVATLFGATVPLDGLRHWLAGETVSVPEGWQAETLAVEDGMPVLMELKRDDLVLRLKVDEWSAP